jgi:hypothetical protein
MHYKAPRLYFENKLGGTVVTMGNTRNVYNRLGWYSNGRGHYGNKMAYPRINTELIKKIINFKTYTIGNVFMT